MHFVESYICALKAKSLVQDNSSCDGSPRWTTNQLNGPIHILTSLLCFVTASGAEAELGALFANATKGNIIHIILEERRNGTLPTTHTN